MVAGSSGETQGTDPSVLKAFLALQFIGLAGIIIIICAALLSRTRERTSAWYSFCFSLIVYCLSYTLLSFAGQQTGPDPSPGLCVTQAALVYAAPTLVAGTTLALIIQLRQLLLSITGESKSKGVLLTYTLLIAPYVVYGGIFIEALVIGLQNFDKVLRARSDVYCIIHATAPGKVSAVLSVAINIATLAVEVTIGIHLYRRWHSFRSLDRSGEYAFATLSRTVIFSFFGIIVIVIGIVFTSEVSSPIPNVFIALVPVEAVLIFGFQKDLIRVFWRKRPVSKFDLPLQRPSTLGNRRGAHMPLGDVAAGL